MKRRGHHARNGNYWGCDRGRSSKDAIGDCGCCAELPPSRSTPLQTSLTASFSHTEPSEEFLFRGNSARLASVQRNMPSV